MAILNADHPITKSSQDRLNRTVFAKYLARCMLDHQNTECLTLSLHGQEGVGKTSLINLVIEELQFAASNLLDKDKPLIINCNIWQFSGQPLLASFFQLFSSAFRQHASYFKNPALGIKLISKYITTYTSATLFNKDNDFILAKQQLHHYLYEENHKIIILLDNISYLNPPEIKHIFQLVNVLGHFPNVIYLLAFDKQSVIYSINRLDGQGAEELLEKATQLAFEIPVITSQDIENIFADRLMPIMEEVPLEAWNAEYWTDIYYISLRHFFKTNRDVTRYISTLYFSYARVRDVVHPVDFFALTAIEVFFPSVYNGIRENKDLLTDLLDNVYLFDKEQIEKDRIRCNEILSRADNGYQKLLLQLLLYLFPRLHHLYSSPTFFPHSAALAQRLKHICSPDWFDSYFRLSLQDGNIFSSEFQTILSLASNATVFDQALTRLNQDDCIVKFLNQLDSDVLVEIPKKNIAIIICALLDNGDLFPPGIKGPLHLDTLTRIHRITHRLLQRFSQTEDRFLILQEAISKAEKSVFSLVYEIRAQEQQHREEEDTYLPLEQRDLSSDQLELLEKLLVLKIQAWSEHGRLEEHPQLLSLLYAWKDFGEEEKCKEFVKQMIQTERGLLAFLVACFDAAIVEAMTVYRKTYLWDNSISHVESFIPIHALAKHAVLLFEGSAFEKLREKEQLALLIFLDLTKVPTNKIIPQTA